MCSFISKSFKNLIVHLRNTQLRFGIRWRNLHWLLLLIGKYINVTYQVVKFGAQTKYFQQYDTQRFQIFIIDLPSAFCKSFRRI